MIQIGIQLKRVSRIDHAIPIYFCPLETENTDILFANYFPDIEDFTLIEVNRAAIY